MYIGKRKYSLVGFSICFLINFVILIALLQKYIENQNVLTEVRREIPKIEKSLRAISEENLMLQYEIDRFENPLHLMELAQKPEFSHLRFPSYEEVLIIKDDNRRNSEK